MPLAFVKVYREVCFPSITASKFSGFSPDFVKPVLSLTEHDANNAPRKTEIITLFFYAECQYLSITY